MYMFCHLRNSDHTCTVNKLFNFLNFAGAAYALEVEVMATIAEEKEEEVKEEEEEYENEQAEEAPPTPEEEVKEEEIKAEDGQEVVVGLSVGMRRCLSVSCPGVGVTVSGHRRG